MWLSIWASHWITHSINLFKTLIRLGTKQITVYMSQSVNYLLNQFIENTDSFNNQKVTVSSNHSFNWFVTSQGHIYLKQWFIQELNSQLETLDTELVFRISYSMLTQTLLIKAHVLYLIIGRFGDSRFSWAAPHSSRTRGCIHLLQEAQSTPGHWPQSTTSNQWFRCGWVPPFWFQF